MKQSNSVSLSLKRHQEIWKPDLVIWNYDKGNPWGAFDDNELIVDSNGTVTWDALTHSITYCSLDLSEYPFDKQRCVIKIGPWMYAAKDINLTSSSECIRLTNGGAPV